MQLRVHPQHRRRSSKTGIEHRSSASFHHARFNLDLGFESSTRIKGTTAVEIASGLYWYLKYWCGAHVSWDKTSGAQVAPIPKPGVFFNSLHSMVREFSQSMDTNEDLSPRVMDANENLSPIVGMEFDTLEDA